MPLQRGSSDAVISANVAELRRAGYPEKQAVAIAHHEAGRGGKGYVADVLAMVDQLMRDGWSREGAIRAAEHHVAARGKRSPRFGMPDIEERTVFDMPEDRFEDPEEQTALIRWAMGKGADDELADVEDDEEVAVRVPESPQGTNYTCGPAALRGALAAFGLGATEDELAELAGTSADGGTSVYGLVDAAESFGLQTEVVEGMNLIDLIEAMAEGSVVIACIQAGNDVDGFDASHWVVPCAIEAEGGAALNEVPEEKLTVECMDPAVDGARSVCSAPEFVARWHGVDMGGETYGLALVLTGDAPAALDAVEQPQMPF